MYFKHYCSCISGDQEEYLSRELRQQSLAAVQDVPTLLYLGITTTGFCGTSTGRKTNCIVLSADGRRKIIFPIESCSPDYFIIVTNFYFVNKSLAK